MQKNKVAIKELMKQLKELGFYKYTEPQKIARAENNAVKNEWPFNDITKRGEYIADSEDLAECGVKDFLTEISLFLELQGVKINSIEENFTVDGAYSVIVDGKEFEMYSEIECKEEEIWTLTNVRAFMLVNTLLEQADSDERCYLLYGGNDAMAVFLTPAMYEAISQSPALAQREKPMSVEGGVEAIQRRYWFGE